eukprot:4846751-Amphidinium_carterae.1
MFFAVFLASKVRRVISSVAQPLLKQTWRDPPYHKDCTEPSSFVMHGFKLSLFCQDLGRFSLLLSVGYIPCQERFL